jgi:hypothetical protein
VGIGAVYISQDTFERLTVLSKRSSELFGTPLSQPKLMYVYAGAWVSGEIRFATLPTDDQAVAVLRSVHRDRAEVAAAAALEGEEGVRAA